MTTDWIEFAGYLACGLVFATFYMKTLIPLRLLAIASNIVFIVYAAGLNLMPILVLHAALLPLNLWRTWEQVHIHRKLRAVAKGPVAVETLVPFMERKRFAKGKVLFLKGETAKCIYYVTIGTVDIPELAKTLTPGTLFGEVGVFTPDRLRTASAVCAEDCELLVMNDRDIVRLCLRDPAFGLFMTRLIAGRMAENQG